MDFISNNNFTSLEEICNKFDCIYDPKYEYISDYILGLFNYKIIETDNVDKLFWNGKYYKNIEKDYGEMKKYYLMAIELIDSSSMYNLGHYYHIIEKDYGEMKKYYLMAIELNDSSAMYNLGHYYKFIEKDYGEMKKYYLMAIELNHSKSMYNLGVYYKNIEKDYGDMKKYFLMAIKLNHSKAIEICIKNNYFNDNEIKKAILEKKFKIVDEEILCPITLDNTTNCYITNCNHKFSSAIIECKICPLCRGNLFI